MTKRTCSSPECDRPHYARGYCNSHYWRLRNGRDPNTPLIPRYDTIAEALDAQSKWNGDCLEWTGARVGEYGQANARGVRLYAHRASWEQANGPVPDGCEVDHICRNTLCINPEHLRPATRKQNSENLDFHKNSGSGIRGVSWHKGRNKWQVTVRHNYKKHYGGLFDNLEDAERAAIDLRNRLFTYNVENDVA